MTAVDVPAPRCVTSPRVGLLAVKTGLGTVMVTSEATECPHLRVTPILVEDGDVAALSGQWRLTHVWTGLAISPTDGLDVDELRAVARLVGEHPGWAVTTVEELREQAMELMGLVQDALWRVVVP